MAWLSPFYGVKAYQGSSFLRHGVIMLADILALLVACLIISIVAIFAASFLVGFCIFSVYVLEAIDARINKRKYDRNN